MMTTSRNRGTDWGISSADLPDRIEGWRVLEVGGDGEDRFTELGASEFVACEQPAEAINAEGGAFQLAHFSADLETELHPLSVYAWLWHLLAPDATLVVGSRVLADPAHSQYADFAPAESGAGHRWIPGKLTLRWMVENSGFDVRRWLGERDEQPGRASAYLQAVRVDRVPALDLTRQPLSAGKDS
jgi:hypothetical protein